MAGWRLQVLPFLLYMVGAVQSRNSVIGVRTKCDQDGMEVSLLFEDEFHGLVFSRGFSRQCNTTGDSTNKLALHLHPAHCSLRISKEDDKLVYSTVVVVQMSASLQQANDPSFPVSCHLNQDMLTVKHSKHHTNNRNGRVLARPARAWMEVKGSAISGFSNTLTVGEHTTLAIYTSLPEGVVGQPVECEVHDGQGTRQPLSDSHGCPADPTLVPRLRYNPRANIWITAFPAFSFPDSNLVHYVCKLMLCSNSCPQIDCATDTSRSGRDVTKWDDTGVLDVVELYNSVEVTAPNIELGFLKKEIDDALHEDPEEESGSLCMSAPRVAVVFALLGGVFLTATIAALCFLLTRRRARGPAQFHILRPPSPNSLWSFKI